MDWSLGPWPAVRRCYERVGHLQLYERHHDRGQADVRAQVQTALGIPTTHIEGARVRDREPGVSSRVLGALHAPLDGIADHEATTRAYAVAAQRAGAVIRTGAEVVGVVRDRDGTRVASVTLANGDCVEVGRELILLVNGGTGDLLTRAFNYRLPVWTIYPHVVLSTSASVAPFQCYVGHVSRPVALKMVPGGAVMLSGWRGRVNPDTGRGETTEANVAGNWAEAVALFPAIGQLSVAESTSDRPETNALDQIPIVDRVPGVANAFVACGWTGHGWAIAPAVAPHLAQWALDGDAPEILKPFTLARFPRIDS